MSFDEKFDKIIRNKISDAEDAGFEFDESNWQKASRMIDAERGAAGGAKSSKLFLLFGTLFLGVATIAFLSLTMNSAKETAQTKTNNDQSAIEQTAGNSNVNENVLAENKGSVNNSNNATVNGNNENLNTSSSNPTSNTNSNENITTPVNNSDVAITKNQSAASSESNSEVNSTLTSRNNAVTNSNRKISSGSSSKNKQNGYYAGKTYSSKGNASKGITEKMIEENTSSSAEVVNTTTESYDYLEMHSSVLQIWSKEATLKRGTYDFIRIDPDYFKRNRRGIHYMNIEGGVAYLAGWNTPNGRDAVGLNAFAGINYGVYLHKKLSMSVGAQVYNVSNIDQPFYSKTTYNYDFGSNGTVTNITTNSLLYASVPVKLTYNISRMGKIGVGLNAGMVFNGKSTLEKYTETDGVKKNVSKTIMPGYYEGVNQRNILVSAFYSQRLNKRTFLNGEIMYSLSDTYSNAVTKTQIKENNMGIRLSVQYNLFDK